MKHMQLANMIEFLATLNASLIKGKSQGYINKETQLILDHLDDFKGYILSLQDSEFNNLFTLFQIKAIQMDKKEGKIQSRTMNQSMLKKLQSNPDRIEIIKEMILKLD